MIYLISVVFIAELIILYNVVLFLIRTDRYVCLLTTQVDKGRTKLKWRMGKITEITEGINEIIPIVKKKLLKSRRNIIIRILNSSAQSLILLFFKPKYKKILLGIKTLAGVARKYLRI